jgi:uncharacterized protein
MIVDCHTRIWASEEQLGRASVSDHPPVNADESRHRAAIDPVDKAIVLGFKSRYLGAEIPNRFVAEYQRRNANKVIGFAGIDPLDPNWKTELRAAADELNLKGVVVSPEMQNFHPTDTRAMRLYEECTRRRLPLLFEQDHRNPAAKMRYAEPLLLDEVAQEFPDLRIVIARLGYPWVPQTVVLLAKHANVYADIAGLLPQRWTAYTALVAAHEYGVLDKLLFGSDFPFRSPALCIESLYSLNQFCLESNLERIPRELLRGIVERDALAALGIEAQTPSPVKRTSQIFDEE